MKLCFKEFHGKVEHTITGNSGDCYALTKIASLLNLVFSFRLNQRQEEVQAK